MKLAQDVREDPNHTIEGIRALVGLYDVWCDSSAVTEAGGFAIVETLGHDLLWGSDIPVSHCRGQCVAIRDQFLWDVFYNSDRQLFGLQPMRRLVLEFEAWKLRRGNPLIQRGVLMTSAPVLDPSGTELTILT